MEASSRRKGPGGEQAPVRKRGIAEAPPEAIFYQPSASDKPHKAKSKSVVERLDVDSLDMHRSTSAPSMPQKKASLLIKHPTTQDIWAGFFVSALNMEQWGNRGQVVKAATLVPYCPKASEVPLTSVWVTTRDYAAKSPGDLSLQAGEKVVVTDDAGPQWLIGHKLVDPARRSGLFPRHSVAQLREGEVAAQVVANTNVPLPRTPHTAEQPKPLKLYRNQVVFAREHASREGWARVRTEAGTEAAVPFTKLILPKPVAKELRAAIVASVSP